MTTTSTKKTKKTKTAVDDDDNQKCGLGAMCVPNENTTHRTTLASHITACCENVFNVIHPIASIKMAYKAGSLGLCVCGVLWFNRMEFSEDA